ncbi:hypothetical protein BIZ78_gp241 [Erwinia phage vB_EamM_Caitlin]|uniref:hypothetical protein n=1 Tax=Erwinia phage vB_EamM_Caitlin TaxID=1883379 RepID=UPI00081C9962|nr:hypothetical protein BIZ78_gp241 [Erwinia phage vB_EamM_Caitlin]ANZ48334.1 hypothetical protein CAITLIN_39 [Erwinia phage vB_EamM_Caitlin]
MINTELFNNKWCFPQTEPDNQGKTRKIGIEPNFFKDSQDCEGLKFSYSFAKGEGLYYNANPEICQAFLDALRDVLRKSEKDVISFSNTSGNRGQVTLSVGRGDDLVPFVAISGEINGQRRNKKFYFPVPKNYIITRNGAPLSDLESAERMARVFTERFHKFQEWLDASYKAKVWNPTGGGNPGRGGYNNGGGQGGGYQNQGGGQQSAPPSDANFDEYL